MTVFVSTTFANRYLIAVLVSPKTPAIGPNLTAAYRQHKPSGFN